MEPDRSLSAHILGDSLFRVMVLFGREEVGVVYLQAVVKGGGISRPSSSCCSLCWECLIGKVFCLGCKQSWERGSLWEVSLKLWMSEFLSDGGKQEPSTLVIFVTRCFLLCFQPKPALYFLWSPNTVSLALHQFILNENPRFG